MAQTPTDPTKAQVWITKGIDDLDFEFYFPQGPKGDPGGLTLGTNLGTNNLNDYLTSGVYRQGVTADATLLRNYPMDQQSGTMLVIERVTGNTVTQIFYPIYIPSLQFIRMYNNGTWSTWRSFGATRVDQTAGRAMYQWDAVNNREQLIYGDTGWRDITALTTGAVGAMYIRRVDNQVTLLGNSVNAASTVTGVRVIMNANLVNGFQPHISTRTPAFTFSGSTYMFEILANGEMRTYTAETSPNAASFTLSYPVSTPWPTTLPGTAYGTIPNN